ncbi:MAG: NUDIX domain-containing protein [Candidatus Gracilibacteria bacterium]|nr:NUDIX domain-containing protein [Candidatus Gracilibacteria bacterium]MDD3120455.1 NUDIX domain-containing protein [Candidatus Gracilibacteria bacterium]
MEQKITACAYIYNENNEILVLRRSSEKELFPGLWEILGGHLEYGETLEEGLKREIKEELNLEIEIGEIVHVFTYVHPNKEKKKHYVEVDFLCKISNPDFEIKLNPKDHIEYKWLQEKDIDITKNDTEYNGTYDALKKAFKKLNKSN